MQDVVVAVDDFKAYALAKDVDTLEVLAFYPQSLTNTRVLFQRFPDRSVGFFVWNGVAYEQHPASFVSGLFEKSMRQRQSGLALSSSSYNYSITTTGSHNILVDTKGSFEDEAEAKIAEYIRNHFLPENKFILPYKNSINTVLNSLEIPVTQALWKDCINITNSDVHSVKKGIVELGKLTSFKDAIEKAFGSSGPKLTRLVASRLYEQESDSYTQMVSGLNIAGANAVYDPNMVINNVMPTVSGFASNSNYYQMQSPQRLVERLSLKVFNFGFLLNGLIPLDYIHDVVEKAPLLDLTENFTGFNGLSEVTPGITTQIRKFLGSFNAFKIKKIMLTAHNDGELMDSARQYLEHEGKITLPEDFKTLKELHDIISRQYRKFKTENKPFALASEMVAADNHKIDEDLILSFPKDTYELFDWGQEFNNCVASYGERMLDGELIIVGIRNNTKDLKYCIEIRNNYIVQFRSHHNGDAIREEETKVREFLSTLNFKTKESGLTSGLVAGNGIVALAGDATAVHTLGYINNNLVFNDGQGNLVPLTMNGNGQAVVAQGSANALQITPAPIPQIIPDPVIPDDTVVMRNEATLEVAPPENGIYTIAGVDGNPIQVLPNL